MPQWGLRWSEWMHLLSGACEEFSWLLCASLPSRFVSSQSHLTFALWYLCIKAHIFIDYSGCDNGVCDGSQCNCNRGYIFDVQTKLCVPVCNPSCGRGNCTAPNQCSCVDGYELGANGECKPKCTGGCQYGECVAPEKCDCPQGFALVDTTCMPICSK